jgi:hypothetical protein
MAFLSQNNAKLCKNLIIILVFEKNAIFCRKLAKIGKIVIITSTPDCNAQRAVFRTDFRACS